MSIEVAVRVDEEGNLQIPDEIQRQLFPGMMVMLKLSEEKEMADLTPNDTIYRILENQSEPPGLVRENGILVFRGEIEDGFDWDAFMQEDREAPLHPYEPDQR